MAEPTRILLQTTIPFTVEDWHIGRFSLLAGHLRSLRGDGGAPLYLVETRDRDADLNAPDSVLATLDRSDLDELWLFAVDSGDGLTAEDRMGITKFRERGGGILAARDHNDLGSSLAAIGGIGAAHYFHSHNHDPNPERCCRDDRDNPDIDYPNYHSGSNGDYQTIEIAGELHETLKRADGTAIEYFPSHPHEGDVGVPPNETSARIIAHGKSRTTGNTFNLSLAFDNLTDQHGNTLGRAVAESSFHHFVDYNWNVELGAPFWVTGPPGDEVKRRPELLEDIKRYAENLAKWMAPVR